MYSGALCMDVLGSVAACRSSAAINKWSVSLNVKLNNTIPTRAPSICIPFISGQYSLFLLFLDLQWKKAVIATKEKLGKIWHFDV